MTNGRDKTDPSDRSNPPPPSRLGSRHPGLVQLQDHPELIPVLTQAVDQVLTSSHINQVRDADLIEDVERAATAAALIVYERMEDSVVQASDAAADARRARADSVAATAEVIAERVTDAATELNAVEEAAADYLVQVAAKAAADLAASVSPDDETAAAAAAAVVVQAVSDAAAINAEAVAESASIVAHAAADAAADAAEEAAATAHQAESEVIADALERHQDALETCSEVAAATAQAVLTTTNPAQTSSKRPINHLR